MQVVIYHNPKCSKSRQTLQLIKDQGIEPEVIQYLKTPPSKIQLKKILNFLSLQPRDLMRKKEQEYQDNNLADTSLNTENLVDAMIQHPKLIERPIVIVDDKKAAIGRPPEQVLAILQR